MKKNIIFDLGNVLVKWDPQSVIDKTFIDTQHEGKHCRDIFHADDWNAFDRGEITEEEIKIKLAERLELSNELSHQFIENIKQSLTRLPDSVALLEELAKQGHGIYCLSNMPREFYTHLLAAHDFWHHFDHITISGHVNMIKPDEKIYEYVIQTNNLTPEHSVFIDDLAINIEAARSCGLKGIQFIDIVDCRQNLVEILG